MIWQVEYTSQINHDNFRFYIFRILKIENEKEEEKHSTFPCWYRFGLVLFRFLCFPLQIRGINVFVISFSLVCSFLFPLNHSMWTFLDSLGWNWIGLHVLYVQRWINCEIASSTVCSYCIYFFEFFFSFLSFSTETYWMTYLYIYTWLYFVGKWLFVGSCCRKYWYAFCVRSQTQATSKISVYTFQYIIRHFYLKNFVSSYFDKMKITLILFSFFLPYRNINFRNEKIIAYQKIATIFFNRKPQFLTK